jgi:hypothetical protein
MTERARKARTFLIDQMRAARGQPIPARELQEKGQTLGLSLDDLKRMKRELQIATQPSVDTIGRVVGWSWSVPKDWTPPQLGNNPPRVPREKKVKPPKPPQKARIRFTRRAPKIAKPRDPDKPLHHVKRGGRAKGTKNRLTKITKLNCLEMIEDPIYRRELLLALRKRKLRPAIEVMIWNYAIGKPKEMVEHSGTLSLQQELSALTEEELRARALALALKRDKIH